jgi:hypothetical protein
MIRDTPPTIPISQPEKGRLSKSTFEELPDRFKKIALTLFERGEIEIA